MKLDGKIIYHKWDKDQLYLISKGLLKDTYKLSWYEEDELFETTYTKLEVDDNLNDGTWIVKE